MGDNADSGKSHATKIAPKLDITFEETAPTNNESVWSIKKFIKKIKEFEEERHKDPYKEKAEKGEITWTEYMITRIRKIFYERDSWDKHLISGAKSVQPPFNTKTKIDEKYEIEVIESVNLDFEALKKKHWPEYRNSEKVPNIFKGQELRLESGLYCDIGHVFAGLDAFNHKQIVHPYAYEIFPHLISITSNVDAVTWIGDLGSVEAWAFFEIYKSKRSSGRASGEKLTDEEMNGVIKDMAPPQDMLGNVDAYAIYNKYGKDIRKRNNLKVSEILEDYYLAENNPARSHRYSTFAEAVNLHWDGEMFKNKEEWKDDYIDEINDSAAMSIHKKIKHPVSSPEDIYYFWEEWVESAGLAGAMASRGQMDVLVDSFLGELKDRIQDEPRYKNAGKFFAPVNSESG